MPFTNQGIEHPLFDISLVENSCDYLKQFILQIFS
jgi:hypothetical protein